MISSKNIDKEKIKKIKSFTIECAKTLIGTFKNITDKERFIIQGELAVILLLSNLESMTNKFDKLNIINDLSDLLIKEVINE